jgi:hypothetical protein
MMLAHPQLGLLDYTVTELPDDPDGQVAVTISKMAEYAREDAYSPEIQAVAHELRSDSESDMLSAVFQYVKQSLCFVRDEDTAVPFVFLSHQTGYPIVETLIRPRDILRLGQGDCDDFNAYTAALLIALGIEPRFVTLAADPRIPDRYSHVYLAAYIDDGDTRVALDTSHGPFPGWEAGNCYGKRKEWPVMDDPFSFIWLLLIPPVAWVSWLAGR